MPLSAPFESDPQGSLAMHQIDDQRRQFHDGEFSRIADVDRAKAERPFRDTPGFEATRPGIEGGLIT
jgi:hypothetical protein